MLSGHGWEVAVEVSFSIWGERGSIDVLAFHQDTGTLLVVEVKSVVRDSQAAILGLDRKARLAPRIATDRGWPATVAAKLLVVSGRRRLGDVSDGFERRMTLHSRLAAARSGGG
jgi:hypothetical protein